MSTEARQRDPGWKCPECGLTRQFDQLDPCFGRLPGVVFACCGHGGLVGTDGYVYFESGVIIRFQRLTSISQVGPDEIATALEMKERLGQ